MASSGPLFPATAANDSTVGTVDWSTVANITADDLSEASVSNVTSTSSSWTHYAMATGFAFAVPAGATIQGILVEWKKEQGGGAGNLQDNSARIVKGGTISGSEYADGVTNWSGSGPIYASYGGSSDLWGLAWTAADINGATFGAVLAAKGGSASTAIARIDSVRITVTYSTPASSPTGGFPADQTNPALTGIPALATIQQQIIRGRAGSRYRSCNRH